ncbi:MAG: hypothetical protein EA001_04760 [Oscillatoriales cyanobacterium]|nr:MAG: hypothetical protein EA001_04760 [Oscillatoriales cyanobacterium]
MPLSGISGILAQIDWLSVSVPMGFAMGFAMGLRIGCRPVTDRKVSRVLAPWRFALRSLPANGDR